jgi:uncharacterized hydrophobic protein (TIGR00271 family)
MNQSSTDESAAGSGPVGLLSRLLRENKFTPEAVPSFEQKLFYEGARRRPALERFWVLLVLAVIIATCGLLGDSTAAVIGAMIVAPLMTPIMATAAALVTGRTDRAGAAALLVLSGSVIVVALSWLMGIVYTGVIDFDTNGQLSARTSPKLIDLIAALASGAAGAFCMSRDDIADSLPGVAIAISLVPPLCVVGLALSIGDWNSASGALLLFATNVLAILLAGGGVLALLGLPRATAGTLRGRTRRNAFIGIGVGMLLVVGLLTVTSQPIARTAYTEWQTRQVAQAWLAGSNYALRDVSVAGDEATLIVIGFGELPPVTRLATDHGRRGRPALRGRRPDHPLPLAPLGVRYPDWRLPG